VEVRGFEPLSAYRSLPASTCVFRYSLSRSFIGQQKAHREPAMLSRLPYHGARVSQPEFSSPVDPAQAGLTNRREVRNFPEGKLYLRSQGEVIVRKYKFYRLFYEALGDLGTQPGLHNTRRSQAPVNLVR
jgi:hypothetical protein